MKRVLVDDEQAAILDQHVVPMLMRAGLKDEAAAMMSLALQWRFLPAIEPEMPDNVVPLDQYSVKVTREVYR